MPSMMEEKLASDIGIVGKGLRFSDRPWKDDLSFEVPLGQWTALVGVSGAGKSTVLDSIAGFSKLSSGQIHFRGQLISEAPVSERPVSYLFQSPSLFPKITVDQNLCLALHKQDLSMEEKLKMSRRMLEKVDLIGKGERLPGQLSGGEQARVSLARSLLMSREILLLDEPFAALDSKLRRQLNFLIRSLQSEYRLTVVCVSHHLEDSFHFADHLILMDKGVVVTSGAPSEILKPDAKAAGHLILDAGLSVNSDKGYFYVLKKLLYFDSKSMSESDDVAKVTLKDFRIVETVSGCSVVDLATFEIYSLPHRHEFKGCFYFSTKLAKRL
jgi:ABC-type Fe3+/spermidine/putrescine transport system ATPase subunit